MLRAALTALLAALTLSAAEPASAYWRASGSGNGGGAVGTLGAGSKPAATASGSTVTVSWTQTTFGGLALGGYALGGYEILRYGSGAGAGVISGSACDTAIAGSGPTLTCSESSVPPGSWRYTVTPLLGSWTGAESAKSGAVAVAPAAPVLTSVTAQNPPAGQAVGAIAVAWSAATGATGYNVYRRTSSGSYDFSAPLNGAAPVTGTTYVDPGTGLTAATTYDYVVRAIADDAQSSSSSELGATAIGRLAPPAGITATPIAAGHVSVSWPSVTGASAYNVYRRPAAGAYDYTSPLNGGTPAGATNFTDTTATNAATYRYVVRSVVTGAGGTALESLTDSPESAAATADATPPSAVGLTDPGSLLRGTKTLAATASDAGSGVASVQMQYAPAGTSTWTTACSATTSPYSCSLNTASIADGLYDLRALATDVAGNTAASATVSNRRVDNTAPPVTMGDPGAYLHATVTLAATASDSGSGVASVAIQRAPTGTGAWTTVCTDATSPYTCTLNTTTLADGGYDLRAVATDVAGNVTSSALVINRAVDNTAPTGVDIQTTNAAGGTLGHPEIGDVITYTFSEAVSPGSILAGWTGTPTAVTVRFANGNPDVVSVWDAANTAQTALGSFTSGKKYVTANVTFTNSSMAMTASSISVTLGSASGATQTPAGSTTLQWTVSTAATDLAANPLTAGTVAETGAADQDF